MPEENTKEEQKITKVRKRYKKSVAIVYEYVSSAESEQAVEKVLFAIFDKLYLKKKDI